MGFDQAMAQLARLAGRHVTAAVRTTGFDGPPSVAVLRGRMGRAEGDQSGVFFPIPVGNDQGGTTGLHIKPADFEGAVSARDHFFLQLDGAVVELAHA
jgi:hypothetical protein